MESEGEPSVLVSCSVCGRLHPPESLFAPNPVCSGCETRPGLGLGDDPIGD